MAICVVRNDSIFDSAAKNTAPAHTGQSDRSTPRAASEPSKGQRSFTIAHLCEPPPRTLNADMNQGISFWLRRVFPNWILKVMKKRSCLKREIKIKIWQSSSSHHFFNITSKEHDVYELHYQKGFNLIPFSYKVVCQLVVQHRFIEGFVVRGSVQVFGLWV